MAMTRDDELGGLWLKTAEKTGKKYMSGRLTIGGEAIEVVVFKNERKQPGERTPDYRVFRSQPRNGAAQQQPAPVARSTSFDDLDDEIPF